MKIKTQRMAILGFTMLNIAGVVGTFVMVSKEAPKAKEELQKLPKDAKKSEKVKTFVKNYKKSLIFAGATIASSVGARLMSAKTEASLMATACMLDASLRKYNNKVKEALGIEADKSVIKEMMKDEYDKSKDNSKKANEELYYEQHIGYFYARPEDIHKALLLMCEDLSGNTNWYFTGRTSDGVCTIGEFLSMCNGRPLSHNLNETQLGFGWSFDYLLEFYEMSWVHIDILEPDENGARMIYWFEDPVWNPAEWRSYYFGEMPKEKYFDGYNGDISEIEKQQFYAGEKGEKYE